MDHTALEDLSTAVALQPDAVVSKVIYRDEALNVTVFEFAAGEGLTEHTASRTAIVEVVSGRLELTVEGRTYDARAGFWLRMGTGAPHEPVAKEPTIMLLTLIGG